MAVSSRRLRKFSEPLPESPVLPDQATDVLVVSSTGDLSDEISLILDSEGDFTQVGLARSGHSKPPAL